jgi:hypothetical protein
MTRVSVYDELMREITQLESGRAYDPEAARILSTFYEETTETLEEGERLTVSAYVGILFRIYERAYFSREYDIIGDDEWGRFEFLICENSRRARLMGLELTEAQYLTSAFKQYMTDSCAETGE